MPGPDPLCEPRRRIAAAVEVEQIPSTERPALLWKSLTARAVNGPKMPSMRPASKPSRERWVCSSVTSSPRRFGEVRYSMRSPNDHDASTSAVHVAASHTPSVRNPRDAWKPTTASSVTEQ